jgi:DNA-binding NarL/FixJ family response regulator
MAEALPYKDIAARVFLSVNTVRKHVQSILRKLGAHSKLEGVLIARERGLVEIP